jgi:hypothetical protein
MSKLINIDFKSRSPFVPKLDIKFYQYQIGEELTQHLQNVIFEIKDDILSIKPAIGKSWNSLTSRLWNYNLFDFPNPELAVLKDLIAQQYICFVDALGYTRESVYIQCWANMLRFGQDINWHHHSDAHADAPREFAYVSGNLCIHADDTKTYYRNPCADTDIVGIDNIDGEMILFPSFIQHATDKNMTQTPRISIAFDIITQEIYQQIDNKNFRFLI